MSDQQFRQLYKEEPAPKARPEAEKPPGTKGFFTTYRGHVGGALILVGFLLFALQVLSASETARPHNCISLMLLEDLSAAVPQEGGEAAGPEDGAEAGLAGPYAHYEGAPSEEFVDRFGRFAGGLEVPGGLLAMPVRLAQRGSSFLVAAGREPAAPDDVFGELFYNILTIGEEDAALVLGSLVPPGAELAGKHFLGPFPFGAGESPLELVLDDGRHNIDEILHDSAAALHGFVIAPARDFDANALLLVPSGDLSIGDYYVTVNTFSRTLASADLEQPEELMLRPRIVPIDYRHGAAVFTAAALGELIFLAGGFLLGFHIFAAVARKPAEGRRVARFFIDACRLVTENARLYALVVGISLLFWLGGTVQAFLDPGGQKEIVFWFRSQFATGGWPLGTAGWAYGTGNIFLAALVTFAVNFLQGTVLVLTIPSLIPIGSAFIVGAFRNQVLGLALAPTEMLSGQAMAPHLLTVLVELQGYMLAAFAAVLLPLALLKPQRFGLGSRLEAYKKFALWQLRMLPLIAAVLLIAAVYEALELLVLANLF